MVVNWLAILVASIVSFVIGWLWYSNKAFGPAWRRLSGVTEEMHMQMAADRSRMWKTMSIYFVTLLMTSYVLASVLGYVGAFGVSDGLSWGFCLWLGFGIPMTIGSVLWEKRPWKYYFINIGYSLLVLLVSGAILVAWA